MTIFRSSLAALFAVGMALAGCTGSDQTDDNPPAESEGALTPPTLNEAFELAFGGPSPAMKTRGEDELSFTPGRLVEIGDRLALVSLGELPDGCHGCSGTIAVHYLEPGEDGWRVAGEWLEAGGGSSWGAAASDWSVSDEFLDVPVVVSEGGGTWQGYSCATGQLIALQPDGPALVASFPIAYSNEGTLEGGTSIEGEIETPDSGASFVVHYTGTRDGEPVDFRETYRWTDTLFELATAPDEMESC